MNNIEKIKIVVDDLEEIFNRFDTGDISDELANYIEKRCSRVKNKMIIKIITSEQLNELEKDRVVSAIRSHYGLEIRYLGNDIKKMKIANIVYFIAGILIIIIESILSLGFVFNTVIDILGCFIVWESAFNLLFTDTDLDIKVDRAKKISNCQIEFDIKRDRVQ